MRAIGLMSGTSLDGIDAAGLITDGQAVLGQGPARTYPYPPDLRADLRLLLDEAPGLDEGRPQDQARVAAMAARLTALHADAVGALDWPAEIIGFHGQTILHAPQQGRSWQIGHPAWLARTLGIGVVFDLRQNDLAHGGQGAPLVPVYHQAICRGLDLPVLVVNIGGVANITWVGPDGLLACDTGPGNALLDDYCAGVTGEPMDRDGRLAGSGMVDQAVLGALLRHPYFAAPPPKSLDRQAFAGAQAAVAGLAPANAAATLAAFTAAAIAATPLPGQPRQVLVCGGGRHNPAIMAALQARLLAPVLPVEAIGARGDALEAECFAYLAVRSRLGLPISFPGTTGVAAPISGGRLYLP